MGHVDVLEIDKSIEKDSMLSKLLEIMGDSKKELHVFRGLVMNIEANKSTNTQEEYYTFELKCIKKFSDDSEYGQTYNLYNIVVPSTLHYQDENIMEFKGNEIICVCSTRASVKRVGDKGVKFNNINLYVESIELSRVVNRVNTVNQVGKRKL